MAEEKYIALEETSQAIKETVEGVKIVVDEVRTDVDTVGIDLTSVKNNIGAPIDKKTIASMLEEIKNLAGGNEYLLLASDTNVLLSQAINFQIKETAETTIMNGNKTINLIPYANGEVTVRITADNRSDYVANVYIYELSTGKKIGKISFPKRSNISKTETIDIHKDSNIIFKGEAGYAGYVFIIQQIEILADIQKIDTSKNIIFANLTNTILPK